MGRGCYSDGGHALSFISKPFPKEFPMFPSAKLIQIYDSNGNRINGHKAVVNTVNEREVFSVVSDAYKVVQHDEVLDSINKSVSALGLRAESKITEMDNGARIHAELIFPDVEISVGGKDACKFRCIFDNSYNLTTGLRMIIGAFRLVCTNGLMVGEKWGAFYAKHLQSLSVGRLEMCLQHGVKTFQTKVRDQYESMAATPLTPDQARAFFEECLAEEKKVIPIKYLEAMINGGEIDKVNSVQSVWNLYNLAGEVLTHDKEISIDSRRKHMQAINARILSTEFGRTGLPMVLAA
jgi:hypothetical protein